MKNIRVATEDILLKLGVAPNIEGFRYAVDAVEILHENPNARVLKTKVLYPEIAKRNYTSGSPVERAIRHMIENIYLNSDWDTVYHVLGFTPSPGKGRPSAGQFLSVLCLKAAREVESDAS